MRGTDLRVDLFLQRHGPAEERGAAHPDDSLRPLTAEGRARMAEIARGMRRLGIAPDVLLTSPLARAHETAEIVASVLRLDVRFEVLEALSPGADHRGALRWLASKAPGCVSALLIGHEPDLGLFTGSLVTGGRSASLHLKKGGLACVRLDRWDASEGELRYLLEPRHLAKLG